MVRARPDGQGLVANLPSERAVARNLRPLVTQDRHQRSALHKASTTSQNLT
jgi:hypothetical protein